jgi:ABC-type branched-subunit amino acid transport system permease subunit
MQQKYLPLLVAAASLVVLPFVLPAVGLTLTTATDVVIFAIACMGLNILVGTTGLVSFGHGAFYGLAAYAAALSQRHWFPGDIVIPSLFANCVGRGLRLARRISHPAPPRSLLLAADARARRDAVHHRVPLDRPDRR